MSEGERTTVKGRTLIATLIEEAPSDAAMVEVNMYSLALRKAGIVEGGRLSPNLMQRRRFCAFHEKI